jgi:hypothetical protein
MAQLIKSEIHPATDNTRSCKFCHRPITRGQLLFSYHVVGSTNTQSYGHSECDAKGTQFFASKPPEQKSTDRLPGAVYGATDPDTL